MPSEFFQSFCLFNFVVFTQYSFTFLIPEFKFKPSHGLIRFHLTSFTLSFESLMCKSEFYNSFLAGLQQAEHLAHTHL